MFVLKQSALDNQNLLVKSVAGHVGKQFFFVLIIISELWKQFYKLLSLECLSVYWLSDATQLLSKTNSKEQVNIFVNGPLQTLTLDPTKIPKSLRQ